jgi:hypothetical protein
LDYLPDFAVALIERALQETWSRIWWLLTWTTPVVLVLLMAAVLIDWRVGMILALLAAWVIRRLLRELRNVVELSRRLQAARDAVPAEPDPDFAKSQQVNWWGLLKAGWTAVEYEDPHEDPQWRVSGKPWRVLHKGSLRVPVFRKRRGNDRLYPQHLARMAAYGHLIEVAEGATVPYGVVLFGDGYEGITVPNSDEHGRIFEQGLHDARRLFEAVESAGVVPDIPQPTTVCHACPWGRPRVYRPGITDTELDGTRLPPYRTRGEDGRLYHSPCGDRFGWVPPHDRAAEKGLR